MPVLTQPRIRIAISSCLLGQPVRYDGGHKYNDVIVESLGRLFDFVPFCPEVAIGMGVPRPPIQLVQSGNAVRALGVNNARLDVTDALAAYAERVVPELENVSGYILKERSPSCGMAGVSVCAESGTPLLQGAGIYAATLMRLLPDLPFEEEGRLMDAALREDFIERVFAYHRRRSATSE